jgi:hypothetical protein
MTDNLVLLHTLPADHPDRNKPLIGCFYKWKFGVMWNEIKAPYGIANSTYNQLSEGWTDNDFFTWDAPDGR